MAQSNDARFSRNFFIEILQADGSRFVFPCGAGKYRATVQIREGGAPYKSNCDITIYGLSWAKLNQLSYLITNPLTEIDKRNKVKIWVGGDKVGDEIWGSQLAFQAESYFCAADFTPAPNIAFRIVGAVGYYADTDSAGLGFTINKGMTLKQAFNIIVKEMGWNNVFFRGKSAEEISNTVLEKDYLEAPTWYQRANDLANMFNLQINFSDYNILIAKHGESLYDDLPFDINSENGLISYPTFTNDGVSFRALYDTRIKLYHKVKLKSTVPYISGNYVQNVTFAQQENMSYANTYSYVDNEYIIAEKISTLSSEPNGQWQTEYRAFYANGAEFKNI